MHYGEISATGINLLTGLPLNIYMVWVIVADPAQKLALCFFDLNMALCEILFGVLSPFNFVIKCMYPEAATAVKYVGNFSFGILLFGRPLFQTLICVERYVAVVHPVVFLKYRVLRYKITCSTVGWLIALTLSLSMPKFKEEILYILPVHTLTLIMVKLFCFRSVLRALTQPKPGDGGREGETANQAKMRAAKIILILLISTIVQYVPLVLIWFLKTWLPESKSLTLAEDIFLCTMMSIGFIQPVLFLQRAGKINFKGIP